MEYEIDTEIRQQLEPAPTRQNVDATDLDPGVYRQRPQEPKPDQRGILIPEEERV